MRRAAFTAALALALAVTAAFLLLPVVAIFLEVPPGRLLDQLTSDFALDALRVTLKTNLIAMALIVVFGTPAAYLLATRRFRGRTLVVTLVELPLVLPPAVAGIGLLVAFGRQGLLGGTLDAFGITVGFTQLAVILAVTFVASPFYVRTAIASFEAVDTTLLDASRTLGAGPARTFARVALPLAGGGLGAGAAMAFARGPGRVRRHDHVRRQPPGRHADRLAGDLPGVRRQPRRRARHQRAARARELRAPPLREGGLGTRALRLDLAAALRPFRLELALEVGAETVALVGPSGAGKTTVLRAVAGLTRPDAGSVALGDEPWFDSARRIDKPPEERSVGYVFQDYALFPHLSVRGNVAYGGNTRVDELLERFGIDHLARVRPRELSGGRAPACRPRARARA